MVNYKSDFICGRGLFEVALTVGLFSPPFAVGSATQGFYFFILVLDCLRKIVAPKGEKL